MAPTPPLKTGLRLVPLTALNLRVHQFTTYAEGADMAAFGTSRHFAAPQKSVAVGGIADIAEFWCETRLPELAAELVRSQVDVIVAIQTPAVYAAKNATRDISIVMMAGDPIATGLISNLARPDGNLTGLSGAAAELAAKSLELIPEIVPGARRVGVLGNAKDPFMKPILSSTVGPNRESYIHSPSSFEKGKPRCQQVWPATEFR
jgi:hypothetical protein